MEVGWGGEGGMVGNIGVLASHLSHLTKSHRPQKDILPINVCSTAFLKSNYCKKIVNCVNSNFEGLCMFGHIL